MNIFNLLEKINDKIRHGTEISRDIKNISIQSDDVVIEFYDNEVNTYLKIIDLEKQLRFDLKELSYTLDKYFAYTRYKNNLHEALKMSSPNYRHIVNTRIHNAHLNMNKFYQRYLNEFKITPKEAFASFKYSDIKADDSVMKSILRRH